MENYHENRKSLYSRISNFWPDLYGEEYALYGIHPFDQEELEAIRQCTWKTGHLFFKTAELVRNTDDATLIEMGFPKNTLEFLRIKSNISESTIARLDLIQDRHTYKCIEINSDTPTFIKELFHVNAYVAREFGYEDPNEGMDLQLAQAIRESITATAKWMKLFEPYVVFTSHEENPEDKYTALYLQELYGMPSKFIPLHELRIIPEEGLFDQNGRKIDILYRQTFPIENLIEDEDNNGNKIGLWLLDLVVKKKLGMINPPSAFLLQNKAVQAVIWGLHENRNTFFTEIEHSWIREHFLPTYFEPDFFLHKGRPFVKKPIFGREGDTVQIFNSEGTLSFEDSQKTYEHFPAIYQEYVELPVLTHRSEKGMQNAYKLIGSFLVNGKSSAVGIRAGDKITNNLSCYLPSGLKKEWGD